MIQAYFQQVKLGLDTILASEEEKLIEASIKIAETIKKNGIIHVFGCGHSHMMAEELFYRAGGLASVNPILIEPLMLHEGAVRSSRLERCENYGDQLLEGVSISSEDILIVVSTSGRNPVPIDVALAARQQGCFVIGLTSFNYKTLTSRHDSNKHLSEVVDVAINNYIDLGDATLSHKNVGVPFGPISSICNITILNSIIAQAIVDVAESSGEVPVFLSGNIDNSDQHNLQLINYFKKKIPLLSKDFR